EVPTPARHLSRAERNAAVAHAPAATSVAPRTPNARREPTQVEHEADERGLAPHGGLGIGAELVAAVVAQQTTESAPRTTHVNSSDGSSAPRAQRDLPRGGTQRADRNVAKLVRVVVPQHAGLPFLRIAQVW
ncbi:MAG: hypothetical protein K0Q71_4019, partial [Thermomicrobiales bacterium]|nr:hypothetical protein [Thermomicrobiales bacterium]